MCVRYRHDINTNEISMSYVYDTLCLPDLYKEIQTKTSIHTRNIS